MNPSEVGVWRRRVVSTILFDRISSFIGELRGIPAGFRFKGGTNPPGGFITKNGVPIHAPLAFEQKALPGSKLQHLK